jgi:hypothetical protein
MRTFGTILALLLIFFGLVVAGLVFVRIWQDNGLVRLDINTSGVLTPTATAPVSLAVRAAEAANAAATAAAKANGVAGASGETGAAGSTAPVVVGIESGGMSLAGTPGVPSAAAMAAPADAAPTLEPAATVDPCPPRPAEGFAADTAVVAVGTLRVYSQADVTAPALRDMTAGQGLWIVAGEDGSTAIARCEVIWQRARTADGLVGWVIKDAVDVVPAPRPTIEVTIVVTPTIISPCVGGCPTPCCQPCPTPCNQPCPTPCCQPCAAQPCTSPCGVYTQ